MAPFQLAAHTDGLVQKIDRLDPVNQGQLAEAQAGGDTWADLGGIAVDGLFAAENDADLFLPVQPLDRGREHLAGGQGIGAAKAAIGKQDGLVNPEGAGFPQGGHRIGRTHRERHGAQIVAILEPQALLQGM